MTPTKPIPIVIQPQPCKPRATSTHTDRLPVPQRADSNHIRELPSVMGAYRVWPDGRKERIEP